MRNYLIFFLCSMLAFTSEVVQAQTSPSSEDQALVSASPAPPRAGSFADIATLGEEIAIAQRKIQAMTLRNSLDALEAQQTMGGFSFKVVRVEGFNNTLYAILTDDTGVVYQVGPGDLLGNQYRVSLLRPYSVKVMDINTRKNYPVPFVVGGAGALMNDFSESVSPTTAEPSPQDAASAK